MEYKLPKFDNDILFGKKEKGQTVELFVFLLLKASLIKFKMCVTWDVQSVITKRRSKDLVTLLMWFFCRFLQNYIFIFPQWLGRSFCCSCSFDLWKFLLQQVYILKRKSWPATECLQLEVRTVFAETYLPRCWHFKYLPPCWHFKYFANLISLIFVDKHIFVFGHRGGFFIWLTAGSLIIQWVHALTNWEWPWFILGYE